MEDPIHPRMEERESPPGVVLVEDNPGDARLIREMLRDVELDWGPFTGDPTVAIHHAETLSAGIEAIDDRTGLVLLDLELPDSTGLETVERMVSAYDGGPIVVLTGLDDQETGMEAIQRGAQDYLVKDDADPRTLRRTVRYAIERERQQRELRRRTEKLGVLTWVLRHDIRDEMAIVVGRGRSLRDHVDQGGEPYLEEVVEAGENVIDITESVGELLSALENGGDGITDTVDLRSVLTGELSAIRETDRETDYEVEGTVPAVRVPGSNLLGSALGTLLAAMSPEEGGTVTVSVTRSDGTAVVTLTEPTGRVDVPWLPFEAGGVRTDGADPTAGVEPYLVRTVLEASGGEVTLEGEGQETAVSVSLPTR